MCVLTSLQGKPYDEELDSITIGKGNKHELLNWISERFFAIIVSLFSLADYSIPKAASNDTEAALVQKVSIYSVGG